MQMQSTYWLEKELKMISLYVNALLRTLQHIVTHAMQLSGVSSPNNNIIMFLSKSIIYQQMHFISVLENIKIPLKLILKLFLHVSAYYHHQGVYI
jgi:hypothetical protein